MLWQRDERLKEIIECRTSDVQIVFTNGCFDILHPAHIKLFEFCKNSAKQSIVIIGLNSDESIKRLKGESRPIHDQSYRKLMLEAIRFIDYVTVFNEDTPEKLIEFLNPSILVKGGDYDINSIVGANHVLENNGKVLIFNYIEGFSSTREIERLKNG